MDFWDYIGALDLNLSVWEFHQLFLVNFNLIDFLKMEYPSKAEFSEEGLKLVVQISICMHLYVLCKQKELLTMKQTVNILSYIP